MDRALDTDSSSYSYYVNAVDECWVSSVFPDKHSTMVLRATIDTCSLSAVLQASPYVGFVSPVYELWQSVNSSPEQLVSSGSQPVFTIDELMPQSIYEFRIRAISPDNDTSWSQQVILTTFTGPRLQSLCITELGRQDPDQAGYISAKATGAMIPAQLDIAINGNYDSSIAATAGTPIPFSGGQGSTGQPLGIEFYKLITRNSCNELIMSNTVQGIVLNATLKNRANIELTWNQVYWENAEVRSYTLYYLPQNGPEELIFTGTENDTQYEFVIPADERAISYCFRVVANLDLHCDHLNAEPARAWSNLACADKTAGFYAPNAFKRKGVTPEFKPVIYFAENIQSYQLIIFDRWGNQLFTSSDPLKGWNGRRGNIDAPPGIYVWQISLSSNGQTIQQRGSLMLVE